MNDHNTKIKIVDKLAGMVISFGGMIILASMLLMILFMIRVTWPLFSEPQAQQAGELVAPQDIVTRRQIKGVGLGPYNELMFLFGYDGVISFVTTEKSQTVKELHIPHPEGKSVGLQGVECIARHKYSLTWEDGAAAIVSVDIRPSFDQGVRELEASVNVLGRFVPDSFPPGPAKFRFRMSHDGMMTHLARTADQLVVIRRQQTTDFLGNTKIDSRRFELASPFEGAMTQWIVDEQGDAIYIASDRGRLGAWLLSGLDTPLAVETISARPEATPITALGLIFGDATLLEGDRAGRISAWNLKARSGWRKIHDLPPHPGPVIGLVPSYRDKSFASLSRDGQVQLAHLTTEQRLATLETVANLEFLALSERFEGLLAMDANGLSSFYRLHIPHPEISARTLWGRVWYENYAKPEFVWQSSAANNDFEPKLSLVPLVFGSMKGTFYGMLLSLPLALMAAIYVSHMMHPRLRAIVKPMIELMAAVPTVVIGFLAALWLAPILGDNLLPILVALVSLPLLTLLAMVMALRQERHPVGSEFLWAAPMVLLGAWLAFKTGHFLEQTLFGGDVTLWLYQHQGWTIDQRNCVVIGFALGFAVIPIIFTISEDALSNVPKNQKAAALALGSSRWQIIRRVVLPIAKPGIFAAVMIGFGRAVGETMIVLMATGNTAVMDPGILTGMRTLAANIAAEIPEAPVDSTLYRVLFLSAFLLFVMTFVINTLAETVRVRMEKKYKGL